MVDSNSQDALRQAFSSIATADAKLPQRCAPDLHEALRRLADDMRLAGRTIERVVACVKSVATDAGIRESHPRVVADAVLYAIAFYFGEDNVGFISSPERYRRSQSIEKSIPPGSDLFSVARIAADQPAREPRA